MRIHPSIAIVGSAQFGLSSSYDCHVYAVRGPIGIVLIDAGSGLATPEIVQHLDRDFPGENVAALLLTHAHMDHCGGAAAIAEHYQCPVSASCMTASILQAADEERNGLQRAREYGGYPSDLHLKPCIVDTIYRDGESFEVADLVFLPLRIRGHSQDSHCLLVEVDGRRACFSGDAVFYGGILGVINSWDSNLQDYHADLLKLQDSSVEMLFPGHGLFTLKAGQRHLDEAIQSLKNGFLPNQIGQGSGIF